MTKPPNWAYKTFWTAVSAGLGAAAAGPTLFGVEAWKSAGMAATTVLVNAVTILAREKAGQS